MIQALQVDIDVQDEPSGANRVPLPVLRRFAALQISGSGRQDELAEEYIVANALQARYLGRNDQAVSFETKVGAIVRLDRGWRRYEDDDGTRWGSVLRVSIELDPMLFT